MFTSKVLSTDDILEDASIGKLRSHDEHPILVSLRTMPYGIIVGCSTAYGYRPHPCFYMSDGVKTIPKQEEFGCPHQHTAQPDNGAGERATVLLHIHNTCVLPILCTAPNNLIASDVAVVR